jgi:hypothetical protein
MVVLAVSWNLSTISWIYAYLPSVVYTFISSQLFVSLIENLGALGFIDVELLKALKSRFNFKTLLKKIDKKEEENVS